jgi:RNA polymerase sigma-70 factor, ECF subfamily
LATDGEAYWVIRAQMGDREALELLFRSVQPALTRYLRGLTGALHADDITQEVLLTAYRKLWWLTSPELFRPWLFRIASRTAFRFLRQQRRWPEHLRDDEGLDTVAAPDPGAVPGAVEELLRDSAVAPHSRAVLLLHFEQEMTLQEVAAVLELPLGTVKSRLASGLAALRRHPDFRRPQ